MAEKGYPAGLVDAFMLGCEPCMAARGFRRSGRFFRRRDAEVVLTVWVQLFSFNRVAGDGDPVDFRVQLSAYPKAIDEFLGRPVEKSPRVGGWYPQAELPGMGRFRHFVIAPNNHPLDEVVSIAISQLEQEGAQFFEECRSLDAIAAGWRIGAEGSIPTVERLALDIVRGVPTIWWDEYEKWKASNGPTRPSVVEHIDAELDRLDLTPPS